MMPLSFAAIAGDQRLASVAFLATNAATAGSEIVEARIARAHKRGIGIDNQRYAAAQCKRSGEEYILCALGAQYNSLARCAVSIAC
jgi:hypothetical protein